ncbi:MAG TPA: hypothetical protein VEK57_10195 [Thermoanaerobaculia bacterium]|nr:hypothetical protein [Thermoanaerobaculia bacterium]
MVRALRKHRTALIALAVYNFVLFFPVAFMGRAVSPNDVFYNYYPWSTVKPADVVQAQNSALNDPPTAYFTLMSLARDDWRTFHWNPYVGSGIPGWGSSSAAILSPFILLPALVVPQAWIYTAILFLKLNLSFVFAYLWLREERLGSRGAAIGAIVIAGAGVYAVRWLWQITNATVLYPALLLVLRRTMHGKRTPIAAMALLALAFALAGFPAAMAYGAWMVLLYAAFSLTVGRTFSPTARGIARGIAAVAIALLIALPSLIPFMQLIRRSGYLEVRQSTSAAAVYPPTHWRAFIDPDYLGHPAFKEWRGDKRLGALNNYTETCIYLGLLTLPLALLGVFHRRNHRWTRARWFWLAFAAFVLACMFGAPGLAPFVATIPGFKYSALARVALLLPIAIGYLAAAGTRLLRKPLVAYALAALIAFDLALVAGRFYPYLKTGSATIPVTTAMAFLRAERPPFRIAPFFDYFWPNTAELVRVEDVRSHFGSELDYRRMLVRLDKTAWSGATTVLTFNSIHFNYNDPLAGLLGIRYYFEHNVIDIMKWSIFQATVPGVKEIGGFTLKPGQTLQRTVRVDAEPFWSIELPIEIREERGPNPRIHVELLKDGRVVWSRAFTKREAGVVGKFYVPLHPYARLGESVTLRLRSIGIVGWVLEGENANAGESPLFYGRVTTPLMFERELPDGRVFRNLSELPRFRAVSKLRKLNDDEFLAARDIDFATEAVITDDPVMPPQVVSAGGRVTLHSYAPDEQRMTTESSGPFYLASSEKLTPELRVTIDGRRARAIETDMLFAGVAVPAGRHEVVFSRRIARGWWWAAGVGVVLWVVVGAWELIGRSKQGRIQKTT